MSRVLALDCTGGAAGDMLCAALVAVGADLSAARAAVASIDPGIRLEIESVRRGGFASTRFRALVDGRDADAPPTHDHGHDHVHGHDHGHDHEGVNTRRWREIRAILEGAALEPRVKALSLQTFALLAEAEGAVHGHPPDDVHFHEVGALDAIADIVGACALFVDLGEPDTFVTPPLPVGYGVVRTAHGLLPVPAPATARLLMGWETCPGPAHGEAVTPTGAALLRTLARQGLAPPIRRDAVGMGAGSRDPTSHPNVIRATLGTMRDPTSPEQVVVIEAEMDDIAGERTATLIERLLEAGALDAYATSVIMKKGRPGVLVTALASASLQDQVERAFLVHGTTFGVRSHTAPRRVLQRHHETFDTAFGPVRIKVGRLDEARVQAAPEQADVAQAARAHGVSEAEVVIAALAAYHRSQGGA